MRVINVIMLCSTLMCSVASSAADDQCADVLKYAARNESLEIYQLGIAQSTYDNMCSGESVKSGTTFNAGLDAVVEAIPIGFKLGSGSTEAKAKHFCRKYFNDYKENEQLVAQNSTVVAEAVSAWKFCMLLAEEGLVFTPSVSPTSVHVAVTKKVATKISVKGVLFDPSLLECTAPNAADEIMPANAKTKIVLDQDTWTVSCKRLPKVQGTETLYPRAELSIITTKGNFVLPIGADAQFPYQFAKDMASRQADAVGQLNGRIDSLALACKSASSVSGVAAYSVAEAKIPADDAGKYFVVSGGCKTGIGTSGHNAILLENYPLDDGWHCKSGDQAHIPTPVATTAYVTYCRLISK